jgi:hypothetical protein
MPEVRLLKYHLIVPGDVMFESAVILIPGTRSAKIGDAI